jgi:hypothetical protein
VLQLWLRMGTVDSDANSTGLKAPLDLSIWRFQRGFYTYRGLFWPAPVAGRFILQVQRLWRLYGSWDGDANFTRLNARLNLSIRHVQRSFYTYRKLFWPAPVARRCILEDRHVWRLAQFGWRCEFHSNESSVRPISKGLSAKLLYT